MSAWSTLMANIIAAGTWTNYGSTPHTVILYSGLVSQVRRTHIILEDEIEEPVEDHQGNELMSHKYGELTISAVKETDRDNLKTDLRAVMKASNYSFSMKEVVPSAPQRNRFIYKIRVGVLD